MFRWVPARNLDNERRYRNFFVAFVSLPAEPLRGAIEARLPDPLRHQRRWSERAATFWCSTEEWPDGCDDDDTWDELIAGCQAWVRALPQSVFVYSGDELATFAFDREHLLPVMAHLTRLFLERRIEPDDLVLVDNISYSIARRAVEDPGEPKVMAAVLALADAVVAAESKVGPKLWESEVLSIAHRSP